MKPENFFEFSLNSFQLRTSIYMNSLLLSQFETDCNYLLIDTCPNI